VRWLYNPLARLWFLFCTVLGGGYITLWQGPGLVLLSFRRRYSPRFESIPFLKNNNAAIEVKHCIFLEKQNVVKFC